MLLRLVILASAAIGAPVLAQGTAVAPPAAGDLSTADTPSEKDQAYLLHAREADTYEIEASRLAVQRSRDRRVRAFAQLMITHHMRSARELSGLARNAAPVRAVNLREPKAQMLEKVRSSARGQFDADYIQGQIAAHEEALELHRTYASSGADPALRRFAMRAAALVEGHLAKARALRPARR